MILTFCLLNSYTDSELGLTLVNKHIGMTKEPTIVQNLSIKIMLRFPSDSINCYSKRLAIF